MKDLNEVVTYINERHIWKCGTSFKNSRLLPISTDGLWKDLYNLKRNYSTCSQHLVTVIGTDNSICKHHSHQVNYVIVPDLGVSLWLLSQSPVAVKHDITCFDLWLIASFLIDFVRWKPPVAIGDCMTIGMRRISYVQGSVIILLSQYCRKLKQLLNGVVINQGLLI